MNKQDGLLSSELLRYFLRLACKRLTQWKGDIVHLKKLIVIFMSLTFVFTLAACGGGNAGSGSGQTSGTSDGGNGGETEQPEPVTLRMAWWGGQPRHDYTLKVIELYQDLHPHVTIEAEYANWDDYWKKLAPQAAANELPDIMQMDLAYITQYGQRNQLADLMPYLNQQIDIGNIPESAVYGGKIGEKLYGFNAGVNALQLNIDPVMLKETTGLDQLPDDWTWEQYEDLAMQAASKGQFFDTGLKAEVFFGYYLRTQDKSLYSPDGTSLGYDDDQLFIDYFGRTTRVALAGGSPSPDLAAQVKGIEDDFLVKNEAVSVWQWSNQYIALQQVANRPLAMHSPPGPDADAGLYLKPSMLWSIAESSKNKEEAAKFIDFFINDVEANKLILGERGVPVSTVVQEALKPLLSEEQVKVFDYVAWAGENSSQMDPPDPIGTAEVMDLFKTLDEAMKFEQISVEDAAKRFRSEANAILGRNK